MEIVTKCDFCYSKTTETYLFKINIGQFYYHPEEFNLCFQCYTKYQEYNNKSYVRLKNIPILILEDWISSYPTNVIWGSYNYISVDTSIPYVLPYFSRFENDKDTNRIYANKNYSSLLGKYYYYDLQKAKTIIDIGFRHQTKHMEHSNLEIEIYQKGSRKLIRVIRNCPQCVKHQYYSSIIVENAETESKVECKRCLYRNSICNIIQSSPLFPKEIGLVICDHLTI